MRTVYKVLIVLIIIIVTARIALPYFVLNFLNKKLTSLEGYFGHVTDIDIALYRGTYQLNNLQFDPFADKPRFDMNTSLENTNLVLMNGFLKAYANTDVNKGSFGLYSEVAAKEGYFEGYVKPLIKNLDIVSLKEKNNLQNFAWESFVGAIAWTVKNQKKDQVGTKVYLEGTFEDPKIKIGKAIIIILHNAFVKALYPSIDKEINLNSIQPNEIEKENKKDFLKNLFRRSR